MSIPIRLFIGYFMIICVSVGTFFAASVDQVELAVDQATEETLVDTANLLAEVIEDEFLAGQIGLGEFAGAFDDYLNRELQASIFEVVKSKGAFRVYVTDDKGIVVFDSAQTHLGADFSRWNDVLLTLQGKYGARSTRTDPDDENTSVLHVAAPIRINGEIRGVLTVAKSEQSLDPYVDQIRRVMLSNVAGLLAVAFVLCMFISLWFNRSVRKLVAYADAAVTKKNGERLSMPKLSEPEFVRLASSMQEMRHRLEGRDYVENYVESLTHEIKSPVTAIAGALELLAEGVPEADRIRFLSNIASENNRLQEITTRMLDLASLEHQQTLANRQEVDLDEVIVSQIDRTVEARACKHVDVKYQGEPVTVSGDHFLLGQCIGNILDNAVAHAPEQTSIIVKLTSNPPTFEIRDHGPGVPEFALDGIFERFFTLPGPEPSAKSTGLGLSFVKQIVELHGASCSVENANPGLSMRVIFP